MLSQEIREKPAVIMSTCEAMAKYRREYPLVSGLLVAPFCGLNYPMNHGYHRLILSVRNPSYVLSEYQLVSALLVAPFRGLNYPMNHGYHRLILSVRNPSYVLIM